VRYRQSPSLLAALIAVPVSASIIPWLAPADGLFSDPVRWQGGVVPRVLDTALFNLAAPAPYTVTIPANSTTAALTIRNDQVHLAIAPGAVYTLTGGFTLADADSSAATLIVTGGTLDTSAPLLQSNTASGVSAVCRRPRSQRLDQCTGFPRVPAGLRLGRRPGRFRSQWRH
jgi:hypothetical protein